jgi:hypothetical protein
VFLKSVTAQHVQHFILDGFDGGRKVGDEMVRIAIQAYSDRIAEKRGELLVRLAERKNAVVDPGKNPVENHRWRWPRARWLCQCALRHNGPARDCVFEL